MNPVDRSEGAVPKETQHADRKGISSLIMDRALPDIRLLFAQPGYCSSWQATSEPEVMS